MATVDKMKIGEETYNLAGGGGSGALIYTPEEWAEEDPNSIPDGTPIVINGQGANSQICNTVQECVDSDNSHDVAGASALSEAYNTLNNKLTQLNTYSTDEKVIGIWIDGKTLYRKTFVGSGSGSFSIGECGSIKVVSFNGVIQSSTNSAYVPIPYLSNSPITSSTVADIVYSYIYQNKVTVVTNNAFGRGDAIITLEYTKN